MAFSSGTLAHYIRLGQEGHIRRGARVLDLGSQNIFDELKRTGEFMETFLAVERGYRVAVGDKAESLMRAAGFSYTAFDVYETGATRIFDLNCDRLGWLECGTFDVVTNCGTSEHVCNQFNVFKVAHEALKVGGVMMNFVPFHGFIDHGLINYHPKFFTSLIENNRYKTLFFGLSDVFSGGDVDLYRDVLLADNGARWEGKNVGCAEMCVIWKKVRRAAFVPPTDTGNRTTINALFHAE
jgi:hypothetical protein